MNQLPQAYERAFFGARCDDLDKVASWIQSATGLAADGPYRRAAEGDYYLFEQDVDERILALHNWRSEFR